MDPKTAHLALGLARPWELPLFTMALILVAAATGYVMGRRAQRARGDSDTPVGSMVGATLGLLAFMLAFTFGMASSRHDARRRLVLDEANAIATTHLRASFLPEAQCADVRLLLTEYVDARLEVVDDLDSLGARLARTEEIQARLWDNARTAGLGQPTALGIALFVESLNQVLDLHTERLQIGARDRIPGPIWCGLYLLTGLTMLVVGYQAGLVGSAKFVPMAMLVLAFTSVVLLISDLDRPQDGFLKVSQEPLLDLQKVLHAEPN